MAIKYHAIFKGHVPGIMHAEWNDVKHLVDGFSGKIRTSSFPVGCFLY